MLLGGLRVINPPIRLMCPTSVCPHFSIPDSNSKTVCPIEFKLDREIHHHHSYVAFEIGVILSFRLSVYSIDTIMCQDYKFYVS